ncbi:MAG: S8 family serine peptidase [Ruminococcus sp.]|nr:S8 family serine peptidase [Ruminococcus sp.]
MSGYYASASAYEKNGSDTIDYRYVGTEHAYAPLAEYQEKENEKHFRETADIDGNKLVFSVIERSERGADLTEIYKEFGLYNISKVYETEHGSDSYEVFYEAQTSSDDVWGTVDKLLENDDIISAEPVFRWSKASVGEPVEVPAEEFERETHYSLLETKNMWGSLKKSSVPGKGAVVAVIDTGVDYKHKDLAENIWTNTEEMPNNGIDDDGNGYVDDIHGINALSLSGDPMDDHGHGTHVAGVIAMSAGNGGGVGLAYGAEIMCIKAGGADGTFASTDIARAIKYAVDNGADVINMSFGGEEKSSIVEAALNDAADYAVLVASAGNDGLPTSEAAENGYKNVKDVYPAGYSCVIGVMSSDNSDKLAGFSNWDYVTGKGCEYEMTAPGVDIYSTLPDDRYAVWSGTSMSASCVAAAAALIRSEYPQKGKYDSRYIMGQLINASTSKAVADPPVVTMPEIPTTTTTATTTAVTSTAISTTVAVAGDPITNADVDGTAGITPNDFLYMLKSLVGLNSLGDKGDVNCDGIVDMYDAICALRLSNGSVSADDIIGQPTKNDEYIKFDIPTVDVVEDGDYTKLTFSYNTDFTFKAAVGQLKYNGKDYAGEFENIELLQSSNPDFIYEFNPQNGKFVAYSEGNGKSGSLTIQTYAGKDGTYYVDLDTVKFFDENGREFKNFELVDFNPVMTLNSEIMSVNAVGTPTSVAVYDKHVEYPRLNIIDSLTRQPNPDIIVTSIDKLETADISEANNGDGIVQPGETVELGISLWNRWGAASDVTVKVEAVGFDGKPNPYVEVVNGKASLGNMGTFSGAKTETGALRVKVKDNAPNDGNMQFKVTVTAKNGFDSADDTVYTAESEYSFIVQRIKYLKGKIKKDITLDKSNLWIIEGDVTLANDAVVTVNPGTQIQFGTQGYYKGNTVLNTQNGSFICNGTEEEPIEIFKANEYYYGASIMLQWNSLDFKMAYTKLIDVSPAWDDMYDNKESFCDHCLFYFSLNTGGIETIPSKITNSIIYCRQNYGAYGNVEIYAMDVENSLFNGISNHYPSEHKYNVYINSVNSRLVGSLNYNAFLNNYNTNNYRLKVNYEDMTTTARNNYYGTEDPKLIGIPDDAVEEFPDIYDSYLTLDSPEIEKIYPFMTEAYVTDENGERIENAYPGQTLFVHIKFNRNIATDVQPEVSVGCGPANTGRLYEYGIDEIPITGDWVSSREWVGYTSFDISFLEKGYNKPTGEVFADDHEIVSSRFFGIRSEGAVAADDRWLVTGNDGGRFGFNLVKPATIQTGDSETAKLSGKGIAGANQLTWSQDETETLAGYNLYRSVGDNTSFTKLNRTLLSGEDLQYKDTDVVEGQKYYYYFTTVDTDFHESARSNVVECVPLDGEKPTIVHTPVTYSEPNKAIVISADVTDNVKVEDVELFYKYSDESDWNSVSMRNPSGSTYKATLSAYEVKDGEIQYYIAASDGLSKAYFGTAGEPNVITVKPYVETTTTEPATTTTGIDTTATSTDTTTTSLISDITAESTETTTTTDTTSNTDSTTSAADNETTTESDVTTDTTTQTTAESTKTTTSATDSETASSTTETTTESDLTTDTTTQTTAESTKTTTSAMDSETASSTTETTTESDLTTDTTTQTTAESTETTTSVTDSETASSTTETTTESGLTTDTTTQTTVASTTTEPVSTSATSTTPIEPDYTLGDVNNDGKVDAKDASLVLVEYAKMSTGGTGDFTEVQKLAANVNSDSKIDAKDASFILTYYAMASTASGDIPTMKEFMTPKQT